MRAGDRGGGAGPFPGAGLVLDGTEWTVERREPHLGRVQLVKDDGTRERMTFRFLANHPQCLPSSRTSAAGADRGRQRKASEDLNAGRLELTELRMAHLLEVATGFRSGDPLHPGPGEPRAEYDPATTTLTERRPRRWRNSRPWTLLTRSCWGWARSATAR
ncbi:hypothetical protein Shyhy01_17500 [Streptomyces hygroscopicus subsp. hygroscopicus]|nr:hypothetical protein Shyhy01_17500 [Streptomyces hygroscopicus subsp. hygroscopicus]